MKSDYVVNYGLNFSHRDEFMYFKLYRDAVEFFESLDREMWQSAFVFKQSYDAQGFVNDTVEYKKHYTEIKNNDHIIFMMCQGEKF